jgi:hypothetical protein
MVCSLPYGKSVFSQTGQQLPNKIAFCMPNFLICVAMQSRSLVITTSDSWFCVEGWGTEGKMPSRERGQAKVLLSAT